MPELLTRQEVAKLLGIHFQTVWTLVRDGRLPAYKIGGTLRFKKEDLVAFLENSLVKPRAKTSN